MAKDYPGVSGNYFAQDPVLQAVLEPLLPADALRRLHRFGALCGGRYARLVETAHLEENLPKLSANRVRYCREQVEARRVGLAALPPRPLVERMAMGYLLNQNGEGGVTCPLAMTDGLVTLLDGHGTPDQARRWSARLRDPKSPTPLTAGQFVTERQGGSNVSENETRAVPQEDGSWKLTGTKWFCSNPGEVWVTTAKPKGTDVVALFLVPMSEQVRLLRLKALSGTRGKATAEVEYRGARAELIGRAAHGLAILLRTVLRTSRVHVAVASLGMARRAYGEARLFSDWRVVGGRKVADYPDARRELQALEAAAASATLAVFEMLRLEEKGDAAAEVLVPLLKIGVSRLGTDAVRRARLVMAGNASDREFSVLPRLAEDALIQEIWEGTHPILAGHALRALRRTASRRAFEALLSDAGEAGELKRRLGERLDRLAAAGPAQQEEEALPLAGLAFRAHLLSCLARSSGGPADCGTPFSRLASALPLVG